jgi:hypothetical protein
MAKEKILKEQELSEEAPKKGFFGKLFNSKGERHKVLSFIKSNNISNFLFYTDVDNTLLILEQGIRLVKERKLEKGQEYTVWTYLENKNSIGLEFDSSTRANFWKWATNAKIDVSKVAVIGIDPYKLAKDSGKDWAFDHVANIVYVYETIPTSAISWIMVKDKKNLQRIKTIVEGNDYQIKVFFGEHGNIEE